MTDVDPRTRAVLDLHQRQSRETRGRHEYDATIQDLSPDGVRSALAALGRGPRLADPHDEAHLSVFEEFSRVMFGEVAEHRSNPMLHVANLDLSTYDKDYAPAAERAELRRRHLALWPDAVDIAVEALDRVPAPVATAALPSARAVAAGLVPGRDDAALAAHARLVTHLRRAAEDGDGHAPLLGGGPLARLLGSAEGVTADLSELAARAEAERERLRELLRDACARLAPGREPAEVVAELQDDHPAADEVLDTARALAAEVIAWTKERDLVPYHDGECRVAPAPPAKSWLMAMMWWRAPGEADGPSTYMVTPPHPSWPAGRRREWLRSYSATSLPVITVHEVAPGHFSYGRALRRAVGPVRRHLYSEGFMEGWAHYCEELAHEQGFRAGDPRYPIGVAVQALVRITRLTCSIGLHTGAMTLADAAALFHSEAYLPAPAAESEARRGLIEPTYGRYAWGKLLVRDARDRARAAGLTLNRFHRMLLALGSPPLGLLAAEIDRHATR